MEENLRCYKGDNDVKGVKGVKKTQNSECQVMTWIIGGAGAVHG